MTCALSAGGLWHRACLGVDLFCHIPYGPQAL